MLLALLLAICCYYGNLAKDSYTDDFRAFYVASQAVHDHLDPYVDHVDLNEKYADGIWLHTDSRFLYPPSSLFFFAPFRLISYKWSRTAFGLINALAMVVVLILLHGRYPRQTLTLLVLFLSLPMFMNIDNGQIDCIILLLMLVAFLLNDGFTAGICLGVAIAIKLAPALSLLWFLGSRRWRTLAWGTAVSGVFFGAAWLRWGGGYFRECLTHVRSHVDIYSLPVLNHTFLTVHKIGDRFMVTSDGVASYQHDIGGYLQNPLHFFGVAGQVAGWLVFLGVLAWLFVSRQGNSLSSEKSFYIYLVAALFANPLMWAMGMVACFPLTVSLADASASPNRDRLLLLGPLLLTKQAVGSFNFTLWLFAVAFCIWKSGWLQPGRKAATAMQPEF